MKASLISFLLVLSIHATPLFAQDSVTTRAAASLSPEAKFLQMEELKATSTELKAVLLDLRQRYTGTHPDLVSALRRLDEMERRLDALEAAHRDEQSRPNTGAFPEVAGSQPDE